MRISDWSSDVCSSDLGGTASGAIDRHPRDRPRMAVRDDGRDATTHYRLRERFRAHTALECRLETGRNHQIRVHLEQLKHPILREPPYGRTLKMPRAASAATAAVGLPVRCPALPDG